MKFLILFLIICCAILSFLAAVNTIRLKKIRTRTKKVYHTPKLSSLHGKDFSDYIDYLTEGLK